MKNKTYKQRPVSQQVVDLIDLMQEVFPIAFPKKPFPKVALKIGIYQDLAQWATDAGVSKTLVKKAMRAWCKGLRYVRALSNADSVRYDLCGDVTGKVGADQACYAKVKLNEILKHRDNRRATQWKQKQPIQELSVA